MTERWWQVFARRPNAVAGGVLIAIMLSAALAGIVYTPYDPVAIDFHRRLSAPSMAHWLGTDEWGRDVISRVLSGAVVSVGIAALTSLIATSIGALIGAVCGFYGRWIDKIVMAVMDALLAFPSLIMALAVVTVFGAGPYTPVLALSVAYLPSVVRVVRASVLGLKHRDFVDASTIMGNSRAFTLLRHVLPNTLAPVIVLATSIFGWALLAESALSFLGLGVPPPAASWGGMLADSRVYFEDAPWLALAPGFALSISLLGVNLFGDALRDYFDPRMKNL
ncbi:ABC transporter permease [Peristeroidobacter soli]|jgi:peptide/nickel transport system permease protein|uniref:ABC transporter permease n=1 Tax=Peristeroidobacter soli TaxID=2497877 RepID=UPI00101BF82A|nr:ABC transporter permease [Peristeroidobacter soli]